MGKVKMKLGAGGCIGMLVLLGAVWMWPVQCRTDGGARCNRRVESD